MTLFIYMQSTCKTQEEMAEMLNVSQATISRWINHEIYPDWHNLHKIHLATDGLVTAQDFYDEFVFFEIEGGHNRGI